MSELKPRITENGIDYILVGDYYIPGLKLPEDVYKRQVILNMIIIQVRQH